MEPVEIILILLLCTIAAFISGKVPFPLISMGIILTLILSGIMKPEAAFSGFINKNVITLTAMFVIGAGLTKTSLLDRLQHQILRFKGKPRLLVFASACIAAVLACLTNAATCTAIMLPLLIGLATESEISRSRILYPVVVVANVATGITILGQGAGNLAWNDVMLKAGATSAFELSAYPIARVPILLCSIVYVSTIGYHLMPQIPNESFAAIEKTGKEKKKLSRTKEIMAFIIIAVTVLCMILSQSLKMDMYVFACLGACLLTVTGVLDEKEALGSIRLNTIFLFAGVLVLADAVRISGAGDVVAEYMLKIMGNTQNPHILMFFFFLFPFVMTQVMSNVACNAIFVPLVTTACVSIGADPRAAVMGTLIAGCASFMTPIASPCQAMIMEPGGYQLKDYLKGGLPLAVIIMIITVIYIPILFPFFP